MGRVHFGEPNQKSRKNGSCRRCSQPAVQCDPCDAVIRSLSTANVTLVQLQDYKARMEAMAERNYVDLKASVFRNYTRYIETSKEISKLEAEMYDLGNQLAEHNSVVQGMRELAATGLAPGMERVEETTASLAQVNGVQRSNPLLVGECVHQGRLSLVQEDDRRCAVHCFLVPNSLVIAAIPSKDSVSSLAVGGRGGSGRLELVAIEPLLELKLSADEDVDNTFAVIGPSTSWTFATVSITDKRQWMAALKNAMLAVNGAKQSEAESEQDAVTTEQDAWIFDAPEDLDVMIAQRAFEQAANLAVKVQDALSSSSLSKRKREALQHVQDRAAQLVSVLCTELERPALRRQGIRNTVQLLLKLDAPDKAVRKYLENWSQSIRRDFRKLKMEASTELYVYKLSRIFFSTIRSACTEFQTLFELALSSVFMGWVEEELHDFSQTFARQVLLSTTASFATIAECSEVLLSHCRALQEDGLDLEFILWRTLSENTREAIDEAGRNWTSATAHNLVDESWAPQQFRGKQGRKMFLKQLAACGVSHPNDYVDKLSSVLFEATSVFCQNAHDFIHSAARLYNPLTAECIVGWIVKLYTLFIERLARKANARPIFSTNAVFIQDKVLPLTIQALEERHGAPIPALKALRKDLSALWKRHASKEDVSYT
eukprot:m.11828 g.11828  ORF g.11828 m.11828 type:complete len:658 (+) comp3180_c0_seq2:108-2081(+)